MEWPKIYFSEVENVFLYLLRESFTYFPLAHFFLNRRIDLPCTVFTLMNIRRKTNIFVVMKYISQDRMYILKIENVMKCSVVRQSKYDSFQRGTTRKTN
jgi:hypothetical protein